jgi:O-antigen ligase
MAVALAAAPAYVIRFHAGPLPTTVLEVLLLAGIAAAVVGLRAALPWRNPYTVPALVLLAGAGIGVLVSPDRTEALGEWRAFFAEPMAGGLVVAALATDEGRRLLLQLGLAASGCVAALVNLWEDVPRILSGHFDLANPLVAIYQNANQLALYVVPLDALAFALLLLSRRRVERAGAAVFLVVTVPAVLLSYSRGGIAALVISLILVGLLHPRRAVVTLPLAAALAAGIALVPGIRRRVLVEFDPRSPDNTLHSRLDLWRGTVQMLKHRPFQGAGLRGFDSRVEPYYHDPFKVAFPHDLVLNFWSETGVVGLVGFVWLSVSAVLNASRSPHARALGVGVLGFIAAVWVHGVVDVPYLKNDLALAFWSVLGLHIGAVRGAAA